jgi:hypothetical protein
MPVKVNAWVPQVSVPVRETAAAGGSPQPKPLQEPCATSLAEAHSVSIQHGAR